VSKQEKADQAAAGKPALAPSVQVRLWWQGLQPDPANGRHGDRGALARLRRAPTPLAALWEPATIALASRLDIRPGDDALLRVGTVAAVLAAVRRNKPGRLGETLGGDPPLMSALRFRALLNARGEREILAAFRRAVALADETFPVEDCARALLRWEADGPSSPRTRLAFDYFGAGCATPQPDTPDRLEADR
jgi:CRISPR type I-E-associated protein CasB/Cse2